MYLYMGDPIKINFLNFSDGNIVSKYYVFSEHITDITQIFDEGELKYIKQQKINVQHIEKSIHQDDTIDIIKRKIMQHVLNISFEEIYLWGMQERDIDTFAIYKELTQNEKNNSINDFIFSDLYYIQFAWIANLIGLNFFYFYFFYF